MKYYYFLLEGLRMFKRRVSVGLFGLPRYSGSPESICKQIIEKCWNGKYFQTSGGHFTGFYTRDFGMVVDSLIELGYKERVRKTLDYACGVFEKQQLTVMITPGGKCIDFPVYAPDSLAFLLHSLNSLSDKKLISKYKSFLETEIEKFKQIALDKDGYIKRNTHFSSMKDHSIRNSSVYDNCMAYLVQKYAKKLGLLISWNFDYEKIIESYWNGNYFNDDLNSNYFASDANIMPFWCGAIKDKNRLNAIMTQIKENNLDNPFPISYTKTNQKANMNIFAKLASEYETDSIWMHLGFLYLDILPNQKKQAYLESYKNNLIKYQNFLEVYKKNGTPYHNLFYYCDDSMIWCANLLKELSSKK